MDFLPDRARQDGSYDLMIGGSTRWDAADTQVRLIPDFIPPRPSAVATP
jgi:hypothetical protein